MAKKRQDKAMGGFTSLSSLGKLSLDKLGNKAKTTKESSESKRKRALERLRKRATAEKNWDRAMEDEGKKLPSSPLKNQKSKDALLKKIGKIALDNWKKDKDDRKPPSVKSPPRRVPDGANKGGGKIKKKSGGPVKSKYTTGNKRYSNSGKTYPR